MSRIDKPWTLPAKTLVLYLRDPGWRYAVYYERGDVMDGGLDDSSSQSLEAAQAELLRKVEELTDLKYAATWTPADNEMWTADLTRLS